MAGKAQRSFAVPLVPSGQVVGQHHAWERSRAKRTGKIGVDDISVKSVDGDGFGDDSFILVCLVHGLRSFVSHNRFVNHYDQY